MLSATASVMIMVGACTVGGVMPVPIQPVRPIAEAAENPTMSRVPKVPLSERRSQNMTRNMARYMSGTSVCMSRRLASAKALLSIARPVR